MYLQTTQSTRVHALTLASVTCFFALGPTESSADDVFQVHDLVVVVIESVEVAARETGVIAELTAREGISVTSGQELGKLDDRKSRIQEKLAATQLEIATAKAENSLATDLAEKKLEHQRQLAKQHGFVHVIATKKAENGLRVLASKKSEGVAKNELDRANRARREFVDSVSPSEIDGLRLAYERSRLETQQADFELEVDKLNLRSENEVAAALGLNIDQSKIQLAQAVADQQVQRLQSVLQGQQFELAKLAVGQHRILSPIDGVVVERIRGQGDWVKPGDPVVRVVRLNRLRAEGFVAAGAIGKLRANRTVALTVGAGDDGTITREGRIVFISPEIDAVNNEARFWVEFDNPNLDVLPGMRVSMKLIAP